MQIALKIGLGLTMGLGGLLAQQPTLTITSPADHAVLHAGDAFTVNVEATGARFVGVAMVWPFQMPLLVNREKPPFTFTFSIPKKVKPGLYQLIAEGRTDSQQHVTSNQVWIDIERPDAPISITLDPDEPYVVYLDAPLVIVVRGTYKDGFTTLLNQSTRTKFVSQDTRIVRIQNGGGLVGVAAGSTDVVIQVGDKTFKRRVTVENDR